MLSYKQRHDQHRVPHNFQVGDKVWLHLQEDRLVGPYRKIRPLRYGPYTITKVVEDNAFELGIPPFLGLHLVFNVDCLRPYFPPLLNTSDMAEQLTPTELNPDCMEQATTDRIMDTQIKNTHQQRIQLYRVVKVGQLLHQGPSSTEVSSSHGGTQCNGDHCFLRGRTDPGGYWWPLAYSTWTHTIVSFSFSVSLIVAQFTIFRSSSGPELPELS
jgi:hypothetical protein